MIGRALIALVLLNLACLGVVAWQRAGRAPAVVDAPVTANASSASIPASSGGPLRSIEHEVVMYGTAWCGYCAKTRQYFAAHGIRYTEHDIEASDEGRRGFEALGGRGIPVVVIDGTVVQGFNAEAMDSLLAR